MIGNVLLGIVSLCTLISYLPQAIRLIKTKLDWSIEISRIKLIENYYKVKY